MARFLLVALGWALWYGLWVGALHQSFLAAGTWWQPQLLPLVSQFSLHG